MEKREASRSAAVVAAHRAMEWLRPENERICHDPYAGMIIPENTTVIGPMDIPGDQALAIFRQFVPGFHEYFLARTRYIDDCLNTAIAKGPAQVVILGAGYDSRAHRISGLQGSCPVFEVDHPATQAVKRERLARIPELNPDHAVYVPVDLETQHLGAGLMAQGYAPGKPGFFIWEGVTMYLDPEAVEKTLALVSEISGPGSSLVFDVTSPEVVAGTDPRPESRAWRQKTEEKGEPLKFGIGQKDLSRLLKGMGFTDITFADSTFFKAAYFNRPGDYREATPILTVVLAQKG